MTIAHLLHVLTSCAQNLPFLPGAWWDSLTAPSDFTFTDAPDFVFVLLIPLTLALLAVRHVKRTYPAWWIRFGSAAAYLLAIVTPLVPMVVLYLLSYRAQAVLGHWPNGMSCDPKLICHGDAVYQRLYNDESYASAFAGWGLYTWIALMLHLRRSLSKKQFVMQILVFLAAWPAFLCEPTGRYVWWMN